MKSHLVIDKLRNKRENMDHITDRAAEGRPVHHLGSETLQTSKGCLTDLINQQFYDHPSCSFELIDSLKWPGESGLSIGTKLSNSRWEKQAELGSFVQKTFFKIWWTWFFLLLFLPLIPPLIPPKFSWIGDSLTLWRFLDILQTPWNSTDFLTLYWFLDIL